MLRYEPSTPRFALGLAAFALTAIALSSLVIFPAELDAYDDPVTATSALILASASAAVVTAPVVDRSADAPIGRKPASLGCTSGKPGRTEAS